VIGGSLSALGTHKNVANTTLVLAGGWVAGGPAAATGTSVAADASTLVSTIRTAASYAPYASLAARLVITAIQREALGPYLATRVLLLVKALKWIETLRRYP
jgi:hypothetical protein